MHVLSDYRIKMNFLHFFYFSSILFYYLFIVYFALPFDSGNFKVLTISTTCELDWLIHKVKAFRNTIKEEWEVVTYQCTVSMVETKFLWLFSYSQETRLRLYNIMTHEVVRLPCFLGVKLIWGFFVSIRIKDWELDSLVSLLPGKILEFSFIPV
jgi:hypothetical protein